MSSSKYDKGIVQPSLLLVLVGVGIALYFLIASTAPLSSNLFNVLYPKPASQAAGKQLPLGDFQVKDLALGTYDSTYNGWQPVEQQGNIRNDTGCAWDPDDWVYWGGEGYLDPGKSAKGTGCITQDAIHHLLTFKVHGPKLPAGNPNFSIKIDYQIGKHHFVAQDYSPILVKDPSSNGSYYQSRQCLWASIPYDSNEVGPINNPAGGIGVPSTFTYTITNTGSKRQNFSIVAEVSPALANVWPRTKALDQNCDPGDTRYIVDGADAGYNVGGWFNNSVWINGSLDNNQPFVTWRPGINPLSAKPVITAPSNQLTIAPGSVTISASANNASKVEFNIQGTNPANSTSTTTPYSMVWNASLDPNLPCSPNIINASGHGATDGNVWGSNKITVYVNNTPCPTPSPSPLPSPTPTPSPLPTPTPVVYPFPTPVPGSPSSCYVAPNPNSVGGMYTIYGFNLKPNLLIFVKITDSHGTQVLFPPVDGSGNFIGSSYSAWAGISTASVYDNTNTRKPVLLTSCSFQIQ